MKSEKRIKKELDQKLYRKLANLDSAITSVINYLVKEEIAEFNVPKLVKLRSDFSLIFKNILECEETFKMI